MKQRRARWQHGALLLAGLVAFLALRSSGGTEPSPWATAGPSDLVLAVPVTGQLEAQESDLIGPPQIQRIWNYKISFLAPEGATVKAGEPVLGFDRTELQRKMERTSAELESAEQNLQKRRSDLRKRLAEERLSLAEAEGKLRRAELKTDVPEELVSSRELDEARLDLGAAHSELRYRRQNLEQLQRAGASDLEALERRRQQAAAELQLIREQIAAMTVKAPRDGTVVYRTGFRGEKKSVGDSCWRGEKVLEIPDLNRLTAWGEVDEALSGKVQAGQAVRFRLDALPDQEFGGRIDSSGQTVQPRSPADPRRVLRLVVTPDEIDPTKMRPGMRFQGTVVVDRGEQVLTIPLAAVLPGAGGPEVCRRRLWGCRRQPVELGRRSGGAVEVLQGLAAGDQVRLGGASS